MAKRQPVIALATLWFLAATGLGAGALATRAPGAASAGQPALPEAAVLPDAGRVAASDAQPVLPLAPAPPASDARPAPPSLAAQGPHSSFCRVIVEPGDTLLALAQRYGTTVEAIQAANRLPCRAVRAGVVLIIPVPCLPLCPTVCAVATPTACPPPASAPACPTPLPALDLPIDPPAHLLPPPRCLPPCGQ